MEGEGGTLFLTRSLHGQTGVAPSEQLHYDVSRNAHPFKSNEAVSRANIWVLDCRKPDKE